MVDRLKNNHNRNSTNATYHRIWKKCNEFFISLDVKPKTWEECLVLFVGYLVEMDRKASTIKSYISAIKAVLRSDDQEIHEDIYLLNSLTRASRFRNHTVKTRFPIRKGLLRLLLDSADKIFSQQPYLKHLHKAILVMGYFGLLRVGEMTLGNHVIKAKDVHVGKNKNKLMFVLHTSKTHWTDVKPQVIKISSTDFDVLGRMKENVGVNKV